VILTRPRVGVFFVSRVFPPVTEPIWATFFVFMRGPSAPRCLRQELLRWVKFNPGLCRRIDHIYPRNRSPPMTVDRSLTLQSVAAGVSPGLEFRRVLWPC